MEINAIIEEEENPKKSNKDLKYGIGALAILATVLVVYFLS